MARWELAGAAGSVAGPLLLIAVLAAGGGWRSAYLLLTLAAAMALLGVARNPPVPPPGAGEQARAGPGVSRVLGALRSAGVARWLVLLQLCDLLLDILTGFVALYLVDVVHATPAQAALGLAIRLGAVLAGDAALVWALGRVRALSLVRASAAAAALLYPAFLLAPGIGPKLALIGCLSAVTAPWYPVLQAQLYSSLPDDSAVAVSLSSAASLIGGAGPLAIGFLAQRFGLEWALTGLVIVPLGVLGGLWRPPASADGGA